MQSHVDELIHTVEFQVAISKQSTDVDTLKEEAVVGGKVGNMATNGVKQKPNMEINGT